jgi:hypothetical protein
MSAKLLGLSAFVSACVWVVDGMSGGGYCIRAVPRL